MSNPFDEIKPNEEVPKHLKKKVMNSVNYAKFMIDVTELFSLKYVETLGSLFETNTGKKQAKNSTNL